MDILFLQTRGKEQIVREINRLYSENKDRVCVYFDNGQLKFRSNYVIDIEREDNFPKSRRPLHLYDTYDIDGVEHDVDFRIKGNTDSAEIGVFVDNTPTNYYLEATLYLKDRDIELLDKDLFYDARFFTAFEPIMDFYSLKQGNHRIQSLTFSRPL